MKWFMVAMTSVLLLLVNATTFAVIDSNNLIPKVGHPKSSDEAWVFIIRAEQGTISQNQNAYRLSLRNVDNQVLIITERPTRDAGQMLLASFMHEWNSSGNDSFKVVPPNAIVLYKAQTENALGVAKGTAVILANPVATKYGWTFDIKRINNEVIPVGTYNNIVIFIDGKKWGAPRIT